MEQEKSSSHTPGPWVATWGNKVCKNQYDIDIWHSDGVFKSKICTLQVACLCEEHGLIRANASLIMNAPRLLNDLKELVKVLGVEFPYEHPALVNARATIARVEGVC